MASSLLKTLSRFAPLWRHLLATTFTVVLADLLLVVLYFLLLAWALLTNQGIGSLLALPLWLGILTIATSALCLLVLGPIFLLMDFATRTTGWSELKKRVVSLILAVCLCVVLQVIALRYVAVNTGNDVVAMILSVAPIPVAAAYALFYHLDGVAMGIVSVLRRLLANFRLPESMR